MKINLTFLIIIIFNLFGCKGIDGDIGPVGLNSLIAILVENPGSNCESGGIRIQVGLDINANGILDEEEIKSTNYVCNGMVGSSSLSTILTEPNGINCANGGIKISSGIDSNKNGVLESDEITSTAYVCNGIDGRTTLTKLTNEPAGIHCENAGLKIESGVDSNGNGILDDFEIGSTSFVCNGTSGKVSLINIIDVNPGENCENGGVKITSGLDLNNNGILDDLEITSTSFVCNGLGGIINEEIQLRIVGGIGSAANTTSSTPLIVAGSTTFDIRNYSNVDSVVFVSDLYVANKINFARVKLYDISNNQVISNSLLRSNNLASERVQLKSTNLFDYLPRESIVLGISLSSEIEGEFAASGIPYLFLYRSNKP